MNTTITLTGSSAIEYAVSHGIRIKESTLVLRCVGWTRGDGTGHDGYHAEDYFAAGKYLGKDANGIEPILEAGQLTKFPAAQGAARFPTARRRRRNNAGMEIKSMEPTEFP